jgi:hypothetical protein
MADFVLRGPPRLRFCAAASMAGQIGTGAPVNLAGAAVARAVGAASLLRGVNLAGAGVASSQALAALLKGIRLGASAVVSASGSGTLTGDPLPEGTVYVSGYSGSEGYLNATGSSGGPFPRVNYAGGGQMYYESAYVTKDGTLIEAFTGEHGTFNNRVGEYNPNTKTMVEVFVNDFAATGVGGYDNLNYLYFDAIDSLVVFPRGVFDRTISNINGSAWKYVWPGTSQPPGGRPSIHSTNPASNALIYVPSGSLASYEVAMGYFNVHSAYSKQFDTAVIIGGGLGGSPPSVYMLTIFVPSRYASPSTVPRYTAIHRQLSAAEAKDPVSGSWAVFSYGRACCKFLNDYVYWCGGIDPGGTDRPYLYRSNIANILNAADPTAASFVIERKADCPVSFNSGAMTADPYSNTLTVFNDFGVYLYDVNADVWSTITAQLPEYVSAFATTSPYIRFPHADFVDYCGSTQHRKTFFFGGWNGNDSGQSGDPPATTMIDRYQKARSIKVSRSLTPTYLTTEFINPETGLAQASTPFDGIKHQSLYQYGTGSGARVQLWSGDWGSGYPLNVSGANPGYKVESVGDTGWSSGRQEIYRADIGPAALATGKASFRLVHNGYAGYPWNGSAASFPAAQKGPWAPDAMGQIIDKRGKFWMGPICGADQSTYVNPAWEAAGQQGLTYGAMFQYSDPVGTNNTGYGNPNVPLGTGWTLPSQDRLRHSDTPGTLGVDYDVGDSADFYGWGRSHASSTVYDANNDKIYLLSVRLNFATRQFGVNVYGLDLDPAHYAANGNKYKWTASGWNYKNIRQFGGPSDNQYASLNSFAAGSMNVATHMIGRRVYFVALWLYGTPQNGLVANNQDGNVTRAHLMSIDVDNPSDIQWIPFPQNQNWLLRMWDGPDAWAASDRVTWNPPFGAWPATPAQNRSIMCVGNKLVLGPDVAGTKIGVDPWIQVYDTTKKQWSSWNPPQDHDWPSTLFSAFAVPELSEVWLAGNLISTGDDKTFRNLHGLHDPPSNAGRRVVRFKVN